MTPYEPLHGEVRILISNYFIPVIQASEILSEVAFRIEELYCGYRVVFGVFLTLRSSA